MAHGDFNTAAARTVERKLPAEARLSVGMPVWVTMDGLALYAQSHPPGQAQRRARSGCCSVCRSACELSTPPEVPLLPSTAPQAMTKVAAIDYGRVRVGIAVSDDLGLLAHPRPHFDGRNPKRLLTQLSEFVREERIERLVVGLPRLLDGAEGIAARRVRRFAQALRAQVPCPVELIDERWSTREAQARLHASGLDSRQSRTRVDSAAAAILLQAWLDGRRPPEETA